MKHFITFQKRKGIFVENGLPFSNQSIAYRIQAELMKYGFIFSKELFDALSSQDENVLTEVYSDLCRGLKELYGTDGYEPIYRNFPQSVQDLSYEEFVINAICHYWSFGTWRPEDEGYLNREFKLEPVNYREIGLLTKGQFENIFLDIIYSGDSISKWDKEIVDYFIDTNQAPEFEFSKISFKETKAYIGKRFLEAGKELPVRSATDVLRIYAAYSNGDEGLKNKTKFKKPSNSIKRSLLKTLDGCYDLEESFKTYREPWLRVLFYLNPLTKENKEKFKNLYLYSLALRNNPKSLQTFNSKVELAIKNKDVKIFDLLEKRKGVFMRRLNQLYSIFGMDAIDKFIKSNPTFNQLIDVYNYFSDRSETKDRAVVLANQNKSEVTTFKALEALDPKIVEFIQARLKTAIYFRIKPTDKKVFIDRSLYYRPLATNNRGSSFSLDSKSIGTVEKLPENGKIIRCYVHWVGSQDIDLSGFVIFSNGNMEKVGWNGKHTLERAITYSGDNTGYAAKNAEYLDLNMSELAKLGADWVIVDAKVYRGSTYAKWSGKGVHAGWMKRSHPGANSHWLPETVENATKLSSDSNSAYLMAVHIPTKNLVYMDVAINNSNIVSTNADAVQMKTFLEKFVILDSGSDKIDWKKLAQGHILNLLSKNVVTNIEEAEIVFDDKTSWETVSRAISEETI